MRTDLLREARGRQAGQAITEYVVLVAFLMVAAIAGASAFLERAGTFYETLLRVVCLPIP